MNGSLLQSHEWEKYEQLEGHETVWLEGNGWHALGVVKNTRLGKYLFFPYGPEVKDEVTLRQVLEKITEVAKDRGVIFVRVEPRIEVAAEKMREMGLTKSHDIDPAHTWVADLAVSQEELLAGTERDRVRHWRNHEAKGVNIRKTKEPDEIKVLTGLLEKLGEARRFTPQDTEHLRNQLVAGFATLYIAEYEGKPVAAALVHDYEGVRYYMHAAADDEYRKVRAGTTLTLETMVDAQAAGAQEYDFWGVTTSEDPKHPWYGFTKYKKSFDGKQVDYAGTWDLPVHAGRYRLYTVVRKLNRAKRKIWR